MVNIIDFPSASVRSWADIERGVRAVAAEANLNEAVTVAVLDRIRPLHDILLSGFDIPPGHGLTDAQHKIIRMEAEKFGNRIFTERLNREFMLMMTGTV